MSNPSSSNPSSSNPGPSNPNPSNPNPKPAIKSEDKVDVTTARILRNELLSFARGPEPLQSLSSPSDEVQTRLIALREIQIKLDEYEVEHSKEKEALEAKYQKIYYPLYDQRYKIVSGALEGEDYVGTQNMEVKRDQAKAKGIPSFWLVAMKNNKQIANAISEKDEAALVFLKDIEWSRRVEPESFKLDFFFEKNNPFFSNPVLSKTFYMLGDEVLLKTTGSVIDWYPGKCLTENTKRKNEAKRSGKNKEAMSGSEEERFSFFNFFGPLEVLKADHPDAEEVRELMQQDYRIGMAIRNKIIPHALYWYTGEAFEDDEIIDCPDNSDDDLFKYDDDDDSYDDDDDDDDDYYYDDEDDDDYFDDESVDDECEDDEGNHQKKGNKNEDDSESKRRKKD